jgi:hypothetical protein
MDRKALALLLPGDSWRPWRTALAALFALSQESESQESEEERALFAQCTGRSAWPTRAFREACFICGRRAGKSRTAALVAVILTCFRRYTLAAGERGVFMVIAADRRQARVVKGYIAALLRALESDRTQLIEGETREAIELSTGIRIEIHTASFRAIRGYTVIGAVCDETAFWPTDDAANPDTEVLGALRPAMATVPGALLLCISSPYARRGAIHQAFVKHYGRDDASVLVWKADSRTMNPTLDPQIVADAYDADPAAAASEYGAEFRRDVESFISREALEAVTVPGRFELPRVAGVIYRAFLDFAGGSGGDSASLALTHTETRGELAIAVLDALRERRPPFSPDQVCEEFAATMKDYGVTSATADRWGGQFPVERMAKLGIVITPSEKPKSDLYKEVLPLINSGRVELLEHPRLFAQLASLERRTARGGKDSIDHPPQAHDDVANAAAGALVLAGRPAVEAYGTFSKVPAWADAAGVAKVREMARQRRSIRMFERPTRW